MAKYDIFISYRKSDGQKDAMLLKKILESKRYRVFMDLEELRSGEFDAQLLSVIDECHDFILIITPDIFVTREEDWVLNEISEALKLKKNIIPVFINSQPVFPANLPDELDKIRNLQGKSWYTEYSDAFIDTLTQNFLQSKPAKKNTKGLTIAGAGLLVLVLILAAYLILNRNGSPSSIPTDTALPTSTPIPATDTPVVTWTSASTQTQAPTSTPTSIPTSTRTQVPTATPTFLPSSTRTQVATATPTSMPASTLTSVPANTETPIPTTAEATSGSFRVGDIITFGSYEQDEQSGADPIEWQVLEIENGRALLLSKYGLETKKYHDTLADITWENSDVRKWLNETFYDTAFSSEEKAKIQKVMNTNPDNPTYHTDGGNDTGDIVFLLSSDEAAKYLPTDASRKCKETDHALHTGWGWIYTDHAQWWLRTPGYKPDSALIVDDKGQIDISGYGVDNSAPFVVRPALWLNL